MPSSSPPWSTSWKKLIMPWKLVDAHDHAHQGNTNKTKLSKPTTTRKRKVMANSCCNNTATTTTTTTNKTSHGLREIMMLRSGKARLLIRSLPESPLPDHIPDTMAELAIASNRGAAVGAKNSLSSCTSRAVQAAETIHRSCCLFRETGRAMSCVDDWSGVSETTTLSCPSCGSHFRKHKAFDEHCCANHNVVSLDENDSAHKIVGIIFNTSWLKDSPCGRIEKIIKINNSPATIAAFEHYRNSIKAKASKLDHSVLKKHSRCIADGNELLRFHCAAIACNNITGLKAGSSSSPCYLPSCHLCSILRSGFTDRDGRELGIYTTASSGKANDSFLQQQGLAGALNPPSREQKKKLKGMVVCRVIAGRVKKLVDLEEHEEKDELAIGCYDSVAGPCANLEELLVFNRSAVLPCFVVIYGGGGRW